MAADANVEVAAALAAKDDLTFDFKHAASPLLLAEAKASDPQDNSWVRDPLIDAIVICETRAKGIPVYKDEAVAAYFQRAHDAIEVGPFKAAMADVEKALWSCPWEVKRVYLAYGYGSSMVGNDRKRTLANLLRIVKDCREGDERLSAGVFRARLKRAVNPNYRGA